MSPKGGENQHIAAGISQLVNLLQTQVLKAPPPKRPHTSADHLGMGPADSDDCKPQSPELAYTTAGKIGLAPDNSPLPPPSQYPTVVVIEDTDSNDGDGTHHKVKRHILGLIGPRTAIREVATLGFWRDALCETIIVFFMVFGASMVGISFPNNRSNIVGIALSGGLFVFVLIEGFAHIQLSCMNPCAVIAFVCTKRISFLKGIAYIVFELAGSALASKVVYECTPAHSQHKIQPLKLGPDVTDMAGVTVEWVLTGMLVWVVLGALHHEKRRVVMPGLPIGVTIGMGIFVADKYTGGALNPLIVFGPAVISGNWKHQWIYWVGDIGGTINAILLYAFFTYEGGPFVNKKSTKHEKAIKRSQSRPNKLTLKINV